MYTQFLVWCFTSGFRLPLKRHFFLGGIKRFGLGRHDDVNPKVALGDPFRVAQALFLSALTLSSLPSSSSLDKP